MAAATDGRAGQSWRTNGLTDTWRRMADGRLTDTGRRTTDDQQDNQARRAETHHDPASQHRLDSRSRVIINTAEPHAPLQRLLPAPVHAFHSLIRSPTSPPPTRQNSPTTDMSIWTGMWLHDWQILGTVRCTRRDWKRKPPTLGTRCNTKLARIYNDKVPATLLTASFQLSPANRS